jgi:hypothetical protein
MNVKPTMRNLRLEPMGLANAGNLCVSMVMGSRLACQQSTGRMLDGSGMELTQFWGPYQDRLLTPVASTGSQCFISGCLQPITG